MDIENGEQTEPATLSAEEYKNIATSDTISREEMAGEFVRLINQHSYLQSNFDDLKKEKDLLQHEIEAAEIKEKQISEAYKSP